MWWTARSAIALMLFLVASVLLGCTHTPGRDKALGAVLAVAVSPDGRTIAASTEWNEVALFDVAPPRFRSLLTPEGGRRASRIITPPGMRPSTPVPPRQNPSPPLAFSPDGKLLVAADVSGEIVGWNLESGSVRFHVNVEPRIVDLAFFPDGRSFVTVGDALKRWSADTASPWGEFKPPDGSVVTCVAVSPDGRVVLAGLSNGKIAEFDSLTRQMLRTLEGHFVPVTGIAISPDGSTFASTAGQLDPRIWNFGANTSLPNDVSEWEGVSESIKLATGTSLNAIWGRYGPWNLEQAKHVSSHFCRPRVTYSRDGRFLAASAHLGLANVDGEFQIVIADLTRNHGRVLYGAYFGCAVAFTPDSTFVVTGGFGAPEVWNAETGERVDSAN